MMRIGMVNGIWVVFLMVLWSCSDSLTTGGDDEDTDTTSGGDTDSDTDTASDSDTDSDAGTTDDVEAVCGNGIVEKGELCDDGNTEDGDGCSADCRTVEPNYICILDGEPCERISTCGNSIIEGDETCDDGNDDDGDGCDADCQIEKGYVCVKPGEPCVPQPVCGNGLRERGEQCDDGNTDDGDGCSADCLVETGWICLPGQPCVQTICGDGIRTPDEQCDDGNSKDGDGCSADCLVETGWVCPPGRDCLPVCGDGRVEGSEECDTPDTTACVNCRLVPGYTCGPDGTDDPCTATVCGNGILEPGEGCDDGNTIAGDGCGPTCQLEPQIVRTAPDFEPAVQTVCGDGLKTGDEECDDGNTTDGDGCDADCQIEPGWTCNESAIDYPSHIDFRITYRDFIQRLKPGGHPHMKEQGITPPNNGLNLGITGSVCTTANTATCGRLDADGKPVYSGDPEGTHSSIHPSGDGFTVAQHAEFFRLWYRDTNSAAITGTTSAGVIEICPNPPLGDTCSGPSLLDTLRLNRVAATSAYEFASASNDFYPLGHSTLPEAERGFGYTMNTGVNDFAAATYGSSQRNFHFTSELRYFFQYRGGETLTFYGDDDVWVFINGRLAVDIGGIHGQEWGRVVLGDDGLPSGEDSDCSQHGGGSLSAVSIEDCYTAEERADNGDERFGLVKGNVYEIVIFQAERHPTGSNYRLTLDGFLAPRSYCETTCGDGVVAGTEMCDDGLDMPDEGYGVCRSDCTFSYCGDGVVNGTEECDDGLNVTLYGDGCGPGCVLPPYCGDGIVQPADELCDNGANNSATAYNGCTTTCEWGPYCGDEIINGPEECDDGASNVAWSPDGDGCSYTCTQDVPYCGDGIRNGPEECDLGTEHNTGEYGTCNPDCTRAPRCGDGIVQADEGEECDDGLTGSLRCTPTCRFRVVID